MHLRRWAIVFGVAYLWAFPWFESRPAKLQSANELPRAYLVMAMVDDGTFAIDRGVERWGKTPDVSPGPHGHVYSNKAPGSSMLAIPGYLVLRGYHAVAGGEPSLAATVWMSRFTTGILPSLGFLWMLWGFLGRFTPSEAARRPVMVGLGVGSMFFLYSVLFISHPLSAVCVGAAWILALKASDGALPAAPAAVASRPAAPRAGGGRASRSDVMQMGLAGFLAGAAPLVDYQAVFAAVPVAVHVVVRIWRWPRAEIARLVGAALVGAAIPIAILLWYHAVCFGGPLKTGYDASKAFEHHHQKGFLGMDALRWEAFAGSMVSGDNGLLVLWPMALLALPGWVLMWRRPELRGHAAVTIAVAVIYVLFISSINFWRGGWQVGPRYMMAMMPFLAPPIAVALAATESRWWLRAIAVGVCLVGLVSYGLTAAIYPFFPVGDNGNTLFPSPVHEITLRMFFEGHVPWNAGWLIGLRGVPSLVPYLAALVALGAWAAIPPQPTLRRALASVAIAFAVAGAGVASYALFGEGGPAAERSYQNRLRTMP